MESVFVKNMPEATVNRTNQKKQKKKTLRDMSQPEFPQSSLRVLFFLVVSFVFFVFLLNCAKSFLVELWADKRMQKVDLGGGRAYIYIYTL